MQYIKEQIMKLMSIPSPTGFTREAAEYTMNEFRRLGFKADMTVKGCVLADLGGSGDGVALSSHLDTLGAMVAEVKSNGRLRLTGLGGASPNNMETENVLIHSRLSGKTVSGCIQLINASIHVNDDYSSTKRSYKTIEVVVDEKCDSKDEAMALGIRTGDIVSFDPRTVITESGYIKSRFLDDKLSVAILLGLAKDIAEGKVALTHHVYAYITVFEEVGHGCSSGIPEGVKDIISVDMGCVGEGLECTERQVSICVKDSAGPSNYELTTELIKLAEANKLDYALDVYPSYGSDADAALRSGLDARHIVIGAGVYASHGYERSHIDGAENTLKLVKAYIAG